MAAEDDRLEFEIREVQRRAAAIIDAVMRQGRGKHPPYTWAREDWREHALKGCRHAQTHLLEEHKWATKSGEPHLWLAVTRLCMAAIVHAAGQASAERGGLPEPNYQTEL